MISNEFVGHYYQWWIQSCYRNIGWKRWCSNKSSNCHKYDLSSLLERLKNVIVGHNIVILLHESSGPSRQGLGHGMMIDLFIEWCHR